MFLSNRLVLICCFFCCCCCLVWHRKILVDRGEYGSCHKAVMVIPCNVMDAFVTPRKKDLPWREPFVNQQNLIDRPNKKKSD